MARNSKKKCENDDELTQYTFKEEKRLNIPQTGLVSAETDPINGRKTYMFDPHIDPELQWAGKTEGTSFEVDTVSLHVHERIDPLTIIEAVRNKEPEAQRSLFYYFENPENNLPIREAIEFYKHSEGWSNRLIAGDSLIVMNSLLEKEGMAGKVQMIYIDPPYGIKYGSNFQPFVNKRAVKDGKDEDLTQEPETIKAFRDTWELGIHSYLTYLRNRLLLARDLLTESGSVFVQISDENLHHVREIMDEVFGKENFVSMITYRTKSRPLGAKLLEAVSDKIILFAKNKSKIKYRQLFEYKEVQGDPIWKWIKLANGSYRQLTKEEINNHSLLPKGSRIFRTADLRPAGFNESCVYEFEYNGKRYWPPGKGSWITTKKQMQKIAEKGYLIANGNVLERIIYLDEFPVSPINNLWSKTVGTSDKIFVVQTSEKVIQRCLLMTTDPGDLVLDPTCGSGTTVYVAEQWGRRWITCDTSRVSITLAKQRLMTALYDYYELSHPKEGVSSGFKYEKVPHITLSSIANEESPSEEVLYDKPIVDQTKKSVAEELREKVDTVGQKGRPGEQIQNVISVGMLSEGWDAKTVTHIMGLRAFTSQLLCEQVVGRGLRRTSYDVNQETGLFEPEYVNVFGVPFTFLPHEGEGISSGDGIPPPPPTPKTRVHVEEDKSQFEIIWPNVLRINHTYTPKLKIDLAKVQELQLNPEDTPLKAELAQIIEGKPDITKKLKIIDLSNKDIEKLLTTLRRQRLIFEAARDVFDQMQPSWPGSKEYLISQLIRIVEEFIDSDKLVIQNEAYREDLKKRLLILLNLNKIVQYLFSAIRTENTEKLVPIFDKEVPIKSTSKMPTWYTSKPCELADKSHISHVVYDSAWEVSEAFELEHNNDILSWAKNDHLGFVISYLYKGVVHSFYPDFLIKLSNGKMLVLEVKGIDDEKNRTKRTALKEWIDAVNADGRFGRWESDVSFRPSDIKDIIRRHLGN